MGDTNIIVAYGFSGGYTTELNDNGESNIPHEAINLFKADDGNFYWYIAPYGRINKAEFREPGTQILFVHNLRNKLGLEVIALAEIADSEINKPLFQGTHNKNDGFLYKKSDEGLPVYGGKLLDKVFEHNRGNGEDTVYVTCQVCNVRIPKKLAILLPSEDDLDNAFLRYRGPDVNYYSISKTENDLWMRSSPRCVETGSVQYEDIANSIREIDWLSIGKGTPADSGDYFFQKITKETGACANCSLVDNETISLWDMLRRHDDEGSYSSAIRYLLDNNLAFRGAFLNAFLGIDVNAGAEDWWVGTEVKLCSGKLKEALEKVGYFSSENTKGEELANKRMDIVFLVDGHLVIIENKIAAPLHEIKLNDKEKDNQLYAYSKWFETFYGELNRTGKLYRFLLHPDNTTVTANGDGLHGFEKKTYGELWDAVNDTCCDGGDERVLEEFKHAIRWHGTNWYKVQQEEMIERFLKRTRS